MVIRVDFDAFFFGTLPVFLVQPFEIFDYTNYMLKGLHILLLGTVFQLLMNYIETSLAQFRQSHVQYTRLKEGSIIKRSK